MVESVAWLAGFERSLGEPVPRSKDDNIYGWKAMLVVFKCSYLHMLVLSTDDRGPLIFDAVLPARKHAD